MLLLVDLVILPIQLYVLLAHKAISLEVVLERANLASLIANNVLQLRNATLLTLLRV